MSKVFIMSETTKVVVILNKDNTFNRLINKTAHGVSVSSKYENLSKEYKTAVDAAKTQC